ncbi:MAG: hypothetical protein JXQ29_09265 [Planctomycetes bacterium]|nr:hypothetical protein [Planctomycetota bacterium]
MLCLIRKEWREFRTVLAALFVLAPAASIALRACRIGWEKASVEESASFLIPLLFGLFVVAVAADLIAGDVRAGRMAFFAALPVRPSALWGAKVLFLAFAACAYLAWLLLVEWTVLELAGKDASMLFARLAERPALLALLATVGAACVLGSTLVDRGLSAVLIGAGWLTAVSLAVRLFDPGRFGLDRTSQEETLSWAAAGVLIPAFLLGSYLAFVRGRIHLGGGGRRLLFALTGFLAIAAPPMAGTAWALGSWWSVGPGDTDVEWRASPESVSPDGRWLLVSAHRKPVGPLGARSHLPAQFVVNLETTHLVDLARIGLVTAPDRDVWYLGTDRIRAFSGEGAWRRRGTMPQAVKYDLAARRVTATRPSTSGDWGPPGSLYGPHRVWRSRDRHVVQRGDGTLATMPAATWLPLNVHAPWGLAVVGEPTPAGPYAIFEVATQRIRRVAALPALLPPVPDGEGVAVTPQGVARLSLDGGAPAPLLDGEVLARAASPDGRILLVVLREGAHLVRADGTPPQPLRGPDGWRSPVAVVWSDDSARFLLVADGRGWTAELGTPELRPFPVPGQHRPVWFDGRRAVFEDRASNTIHVTGANGTIRQLFPAGKLPVTSPSTR